MLKKIIQFFNEVLAELKKVSWPSKKEILGSTIVVIILVIIVSFFVGGIDFFLSGILRILFK